MTRELDLSKRPDRRPTVTTPYRKQAAQCEPAARASWRQRFVLACVEGARHALYYGLVGVGLLDLAAIVSALLGNPTNACVLAIFAVLMTGAITYEQCLYLRLVHRAERRR